MIRMGKSNHGWGVSIDFNTNDAGGKGKLYNDKGEPKYGTGEATTKEVKWLERNAGYYGYEGLYYQYDEKSKTGYFNETWHWTYSGQRR